MNTLCGKHHEESLAWLDYKLPARLAIVTVGAPASRLDEWRRTIRSQRDMIKRSCANGEGCE